MKTIEANLVDIKKRTIYPAKLTIKEKKIFTIEKIDKICKSYILPGFIDAHIHVESSMLIPSEFGRIALSHGTVATVSDPHEIANVLGVEGVDFMIENAKQTPCKIYFGASPCVPATPFETSGAVLGIKEIETLLQRDDIYYLSEVMNFPGVINNDKDMLGKIALAKKYNKPIDGHSPGLTWDDLSTYINAGITTDHEAFMFEEAKEKLQKGMKIQIREGSAAKNYNELHPLIDEHYKNMMFCSDDKHPNDLVQGHINELVKRALKDGHQLFDLLEMACLNPVKHYNLDVGSLEASDYADFIEVEDLEEFSLLRTFIEGEIVYEKGADILKNTQSRLINNFHTTPKEPQQFEIHEGCKEYRVISAIEHQLITKELDVALQSVNGIVQSDLKNDILYIAVVNRYADTPPALSFVHGFSLKEGAIASSVAHDSHNIIAVGCSAQSLSLAVNTIINTQGGVCCVDGKNNVKHLPLRVGGLMSEEDGYKVAQNYDTIDRYTKEVLKSTLDAPFMTLSFMALLVIPDIKLSDKGLFDGTTFHFVQECKL